VEHRRKGTHHDWFQQVVQAHRIHTHTHAHKHTHTHTNTHVYVYVSIVMFLISRPFQQLSEQSFNQCYDGPAVKYTYRRVDHEHILGECRDSFTIMSVMSSIEKISIPTTESGYNFWNYSSELERQLFFWFLFWQSSADEPAMLSLALIGVFGKLFGWSRRKSWKRWK
jgi:hypothetical protein